MNLYEISSNYLQALENVFVDEETGEVKGWVELEAMEGDFANKAEAVALYIKNLGAEAEAIKNEEKALADRRKRAEKKADNLKIYLAENMQNVGSERLSTPKVALSFRKSTVVEIDDRFRDWALENGEQFLKYKDPEVDKAAVKKAIQNGVEIKFAVLVDKQNLQIK